MIAHVRDDGPRTAKLVLVGEAPGAQEMARGKPFVGPSGGRLEVWWRKFGLKRGDFYITNVVPFQPENINKIPEEEMHGYIQALHERLAKLADPWLIVPTGNYALYAVTGKGKVSFHHKDGRYERPGISDWRGSILSAEIAGRTVKVIPTLHPAYVLRQPAYERECLHDWRRIAEEAQTPEIDLPQREHRIRPTEDDVRLYCEEARTAPFLSVDIETPKSRVIEVAVVVGHEEVTGRTGKKRQTELIEWRRGVKLGAPGISRYKSGAKKGTPKVRWSLGSSYIGCIGLGTSVAESLTVPTTKVYWKSQATLDRVLGYLKALLTDPEGPDLLMQNGMFDASWLAWEFKWDVSKRWKWDTRAMHHALDPRAPHDLAYMASIFTRQPFWKHEAKDPDEIMKYASNTEALWSYNGIDVCVTLEIFYVLYAQLEAQGMLDFYLQHYARMIPPLLDMTLHGVRIDDTARENERTRLDLECLRLAAELEELSGVSLVGDGGGISNQKLGAYLYGTLKLPKQFKRDKFGGQAVTTDEVAIRRLTKRYPKMAKIGPVILAYRRNSKIKEFLADGVSDVDKRIRCQYSFITEAGRLASHSTAWGTGRNLQNIDRQLRYLFLPDKE